MQIIHYSCWLSEYLWSFFRYMSVFFHSFKNKLSRVASLKSPFKSSTWSDALPGFYYRIRMLENWHISVSTSVSFSASVSGPFSFLKPISWGPFEHIGFLSTHSGSPKRYFHISVKRSLSRSRSVDFNKSFYRSV